MKKTKSAKIMLSLLLSATIILTGCSSNKKKTTSDLPSNFPGIKENSSETTSDNSSITSSNKVSVYVAPPSSSSRKTSTTQSEREIEDINEHMVLSQTLETAGYENSIKNIKIDQKTYDLQITLNDATQLGMKYKNINTLPQFFCEISILFSKKNAYDITYYSIMNVGAFKKSELNKTGNYAYINNKKYTKEQLAKYKLTENADYFVYDVTSLLTGKNTKEYLKSQWNSNENNTDVNNLADYEKVCKKLYTTKFIS